MEKAESIDDTSQGEWKAPTWLGLASVALAVALFLGQASLEQGWLEAFFGRFSFLFWIGELLWFVVTILAIRKRRAWWVLVVSPLALYPLFMVGALIAACAQGNCL